MLSAGACSSGSANDAADGTSDSKVATTVAAVTSTVASTTSAPGSPTSSKSMSDVAFTEAGTNLKIGDTATVAGDYAGKDYALEVTVTGIEKGTDADLKSLKLDATSLDPFYVKVKATIVAGEAGGADPTDNLVPVAGTKPGQQIIEFGKFEPCNLESFDLEAKVGDSIETCSPFAFDKGTTPDSVAFTGGEGDPIFWKS